MANLFFNQFLIWSPWVLTLLILILAILHSLSARYKYLSIFKKLSFKRLVYLLLGVSFIFDVSLVFIQYYAWHSDSFSRLFLPPYQPWSYFISYSFFHFFLANIITLFVTTLTILVFKIFQKYKREFITNEELWLLVLACLLISWPQIIVFLGIFLALSVIYTLFSFFVLKKQGINWSQLIIGALIIVFFAGSVLLQVLNLMVLMI